MKIKGTNKIIKDLTEMQVQIKPVPFESIIKCDWIHCTSPIEIIYEMGCCNRGIWWHPSCPNYEDDDRLKELKKLKG